MLTGIQSLKGFGIFDEYSRPAGTHDFCDRNIIYGWNYSGKTTLSRLFHALDQRAPHPELAGCRFSLTGSDGTTITEANVAACTKTVRVFNSDFIADSLNWNGGAFRPILLLGEEAKDAQQKIDHFERVISRCAASAANRQRDAQAIDDSLSEAKTAAAKQIKTTLGIVEVFTAAHLSQLLTVISVLDDTVHSLPADKLASDLSLANSSAKDQLPLVHEVKFASGAAAVYGTARALFKQRPASLMSIESLRQQPLVASWVGQGLHLHENTDTCAFCRKRSINRVLEQRVLS
ncbi:AAA family ATPase [Roseateles toxinivorans]|uniref:AAA domain-containing protein n=1 Tax=Roseateles toxinivorans TaxID=270368 RepID=A0A4R6QK40_9BURK|nr:AAA family ATPase [Roseateles toxinivorans]TDP63002.1 AAA domain-containing protein [Roseateles toxinivorans]